MVNRREFLKRSAAAGVGSLAILNGRLFGGNKRDVPGLWSFSPDVLVSGEKVKIELRYEHTGKDLPEGSYHKVRLEPISAKSVFHCKPSEDLKLISYKGKMPEVKMDPARVNGVGFRDVKFHFPEGLKKGESFAVQIGNKEDNGEIVGLVNPFPCRHIACEVYSDIRGNGREISWLNKGWAGKPVPRLEVIAGEASAMRLIVPSIAGTGEEFKLRVSVTDDFDSRANPVYEGKVFLEEINDIQGLNKEISFRKQDKSSRIVRGLSIEKEGVYRIKGRLEGGDKIFESNPIVVKKNAGTPIYWGNIHNHGWYSECWGDGLDEFYSHSRDISGMDYVSMSDHKGSLPTKNSGAGRLINWYFGRRIQGYKAWLDNINSANKYNDEKDFVTLFGYEWSSSDTGHYNIYIAEASVESMSKIFTEHWTDYGFVMRRLLKDSEALYIPHLHAGIFPWQMLQEDVKCANGKQLTPVVEIYSDWGKCVHPFAGKIEPMNKFGGLRNPLARGYMWALDNGYKVGAIGDSDSHTNMPGRRVVGGIAPHHDHVQGLTAAITSDFSRKGIMNAYWNKNVYATTGVRIYLDIEANGKRMGQDMRTDDPFELRVDFAGTDEIEKVSLYDGLKLIEEKNIRGEREGTVVFKCDEPGLEESAYFVEVLQKDENLAWSSPIWVRKKSIPELTWKKDNSELYLVNKGPGDAEDLEVWYSEIEHPFALNPIEGRESDKSEDAGFVWTYVRDDLRTFVHYRWVGEPLKGKLKIKGAKEYGFETNRYFHFFKGKLEDKGEGIEEFDTGPKAPPKGSKGISIIVDIDPEKICEVEFEFDRKVKTLKGAETVNDKDLKIKLNGRKTDGKLTYKKLRKLDAGEKWKAPDKRGVWSVYTSHKILKINEGENYIKT